MPLAENFAHMGVTTLVLGNCGSSVLDVGQFLRRLEATNVSVNVAGFTDPIGCAVIKVIGAIAVPFTSSAPVTFGTVAFPAAGSRP